MNLGNILGKNNMIKELIFRNLKELLLQLLKSGEIFKGEKRLNNQEGLAHKIKVKIKKI